VSIETAIETPALGSRRQGRPQSPIHWLLSALLGACLLLMGGCRASAPATGPDLLATTAPAGPLQEVSPPPAVRQLAAALAERSPRLVIEAPSPDSLLAGGDWQLRLRLSDWPLVHAGPLGLGPHLAVQIDDAPPLRLSERARDQGDQLLVNLPPLAPGSHRITAYAALPWGEAVKDPGATARLRLHAVAANPLALPAPGSPELIPVSPAELGGSEPLLLDWLLYDAPLQHLRQGDDSWRLRISVNGDSFLVDQNAPLWLRGWRQGSNALQLELVDGRGEPLNPPYNSLVRQVNLTGGPPPRWLGARLSSQELATYLGQIPPETLAPANTAKAANPATPANPANPGEAAAAQPDSTGPAPTEPVATESLANEPVANKPTATKPDADAAGELDTNQTDTNSIGLADANTTDTNTTDTNATDTNASSAAASDANAANVIGANESGADATNAASADTKTTNFDVADICMTGTDAAKANASDADADTNSADTTDADATNTDATGANTNNTDTNDENEAGLAGADRFDLDGTNARASSAAGTDSVAIETGATQFNRNAASPVENNPIPARGGAADAAAAKPAPADRLIGRLLGRDQAPGQGPMGGDSDQAPRDQATGGGPLGALRRRLAG
jgi:hypothetical protein